MTMNIEKYPHIQPVNRQSKVLQLASIFVPGTKSATKPNAHRTM
uniref:Uncharacterized protein n=1 Tax=Brugia malayi TaxID=6279 RepID=A0A8L7SPK4_BRUMA